MITKFFQIIISTLAGVLLIGWVVLALTLPQRGNAIQGQTIIPTRFDDPVPDGCQPNDCSLREALLLSNELAEPVTITLLAGTYILQQPIVDDPNTWYGDDTLTTGDFDITGTLTIYGAGANATFVDGNQLDRLFEVGAGSVLVMSGLTIQQGLAEPGLIWDEGGGLKIKQSVVTLTNMIITNNYADADGGGLYAISSTLMLKNVIINDNTSEDGGGIYNLAGYLTMKNVTLSYNQCEDNGGGISSKDGYLYIKNSSINHNQADKDGGGIYNQDIELILDNVLVNYNKAGTGSDDGGGIHKTNGKATIHNSKINYNNAGDDGGGIYIDESKVTLSKPTLTGNTAGGFGGAISDVYGTSSIELNNGHIRQNQANNDGGAIKAAGFLTVTNTIIEDNISLGDGGAIDASGVTNLQNLSISNNQAEDDGGGLYISNSAILERLVIIGNQAGYRGGGMKISVQVTANNLMVDNNQAYISGGGIYSADRFTLTNSAIINNVVTASSSDGGGLRLDGISSIINTTISGNVAVDKGGGIEGSSGIFLLNSTLANNTAGVDGGGTIYGGRSENSLIANNTPNNCSQTLYSNGYNLVTDDTCGLNDPTDLVNVDPLLAPLADNGGNTWTHALLDGSPALNGANPDTCPNKDQRGVNRPQDGGCDIGAYEQAGFPVAGFVADPLYGQVPFTVQFTNTSAGGYVTNLWDFGDGYTNTLEHPSHTYWQAGAYTITLQVGGIAGESSATRTHYIVVDPPPPLTADITAVPQTGITPLTVAFTNTSQGVYTTSLWAFGDGQFSTLAHPQHTYTQSGIYTVSLIVSGLGNSSELLQPAFITVTDPVPVAHFTATPITGSVPLRVTFTDLSSGTVRNWLWHFGNGDILRYRNPVYTYTEPGVYTVSLEVVGPTGSDKLTKTNYITVTPFQGPVLQIPKNIPATFNQPVTVPITFNSHGQGIISNTFSVDFDEGCLTLDVAQNNWLTAIDINLPDPFTITTTFNAADITGELDFWVKSTTPTTATLPDGFWLTIRFQVTCSTVGAIPINFGADIPTKFILSNGNEVVGWTEGGFIILPNLRIYLPVVLK